jgi:hypothetical protein
LVSFSLTNQLTHQQTNKLMTQKPTILLLCPYAAAKSLLAATYFRHLAEQNGLDVTASGCFRLVRRAFAQSGIASIA